MKEILDVCVIYRDETPDGSGWVAHALLTDHVAIGETILKAYVELRQVLRCLLESIIEDGDLDLQSAYRPYGGSLGEKEVLINFSTATPLPEDVQAIADKNPERIDEAEKYLLSLRRFRDVDCVSAVLRIAPTLVLLEPAEVFGPPGSEPASESP